MRVTPWQKWIHSWLKAEKIPKPAVVEPRRSQRVRRPATRLSPGIGAQKKYVYDAFLNMLPSRLTTVPKSFFAKTMQYTDDLLVDPMSNIADAVHPLSFAARANDEDTPLYHEAMNGPDAEGYREAMSKEIQGLEKQQTWILQERKFVPEGANVLPSTWAFKRKRYPDGRVRKLKA